jgi:hypothetical protein
MDLNLRRGVMIAAFAIAIFGTWMVPARMSLAQGDAKPSAAELPPNYREQIARYLKAHNRYPVQKAAISKPWKKWGGLFRGGTMPAVCVAIYRENPFGMQVRDNWVFTAENGQVHEIALGTDPCDAVTPFNELMKR